MSIVYLLVPIAFLLAGFFIGAYLWSVKSGGLDDLDSPPLRMLLDENEENDYPHQIFLDSGKEEIIPFILSNEHVSLDYK